MDLSGLGGLSAAYPGYQEAEGIFQSNTAKKLTNQNTVLEQQGEAAYGRALMAFQKLQSQQQPQQGVPTGPSAPQPQMPQGQPGPQAPAPGQPSVSMQPGQNAGPGQPTQVAPPAPAAPMAGVPTPQGQPGSGPLEWHRIAAFVAQANPGAPPAVIAKAVDRFTPLMTAQSLADWRQKSLAIQGRNADIREDTADERTRQADERIRVQRENEEGRSKRAGDREARLAGAAAIRQDQGWLRLETQRADLQRRIEQNNDRNALGQWRAIVDAQHKKAQEIINSNSINNMMKPEDRAALLAEQRAAYDAQLEEMRTRFGRSTPEGRPSAPPGSPAAAAPKETGRIAPSSAVPSPPAEIPPGPASAAPAASAPPVAALKPGVVTTFANGQSWTLENGQPKQVK